VWYFNCNKRHRIDSFSKTRQSLLYTRNIPPFTGNRRFTFMFTRLDPVLSEMNLVHTLILCFSKTILNQILPSRLFYVLRCSVPLRIYNYLGVQFFFINLSPSPGLLMSRVSSRPCFDHLNNSFLKSTSNEATQQCNFLSLYCCFLPLMSKYSPQQPIFKCFGSVIFSELSSLSWFIPVRP
jgi:hypothetical protein